MNIKILKYIIPAIITPLLIAGFVGAYGFWYPDDNDNLTPVDDTWGLAIPYLVGGSGICASIDANGVFSTTTCGIASESDPIWLAASSSYFTLVAWNATTTDALSEGATNLYYTNARARAAISETITGITYNSGTGVFSLSAGYNIPLTASTTDWNTSYLWGDWSGEGFIVLTDISSSATGLTYNSGTGDFSLTGGYNIPLTASTTEWDTAHSWGDWSGEGVCG